MYHLLFYDYVENMVERRAPFRAEHLALANSALERGELVMAGALVEPVDGAVFAWRGDRGTVERFVERDPYVLNGLVTAYRIREWNVVVGAAP